MTVIESVKTRKKKSLLPKQENLNHFVKRIGILLEGKGASIDELKIWGESAASYAYWGKHYHEKPSLNLIVLRLQKEDSFFNMALFCSAALTCGLHIQISWDKNESSIMNETEWTPFVSHVLFKEESSEEFFQRIQNNEIQHLRILSPASKILQKITKKRGCFLDDMPVYYDGKKEIIRYLNHGKTTT